VDEVLAVGSIGPTATAPPAVEGVEVAVVDDVMVDVVAALELALVPGGDVLLEEPTTGRVAEWPAVDCCAEVECDPDADGFGVALTVGFGVGLGFGVGVESLGGTEAAGAAPAPKEKPITVPAGGL